MKSVHVVARSLVSLYESENVHQGFRQANIQRARV